METRMDIAVFPEFNDPSTLDGSLELIEKAYDEGNVYEANPNYDKFRENRIVADTNGLFNREIEVDLERFREQTAEDLRLDLKSEEDLARLDDLVKARRENLRIVMPRYMHEAYLDAGDSQGEPYWKSLIILMNQNTGTGFVSFHTPDANAFFPSH